MRCEQVIDFTDPAVLAACEVDDATLAGAWEDLASRGRTPPSWSLAETLIAVGCHGALAPSFAPGMTPAERNLVLRRLSDAPPSQALVIDDFGRLPKDDAS